MKPYKHQQELLDLAPNKYGLFWGTGTGKSLAALWLVEEKRSLGSVCLVICPKSLKEKWQRDCNKMLGIYRVMTKEEFKRDAMKLPGYENLLIDEAHYFSGMRGFKQKSGMLKALLFYVKKWNPTHIYLLTATPYMSTPYNVFALGNILGYFNKKDSYKTFQDHFFTKVNMGGKWPIPVIKDNIEEDIAYFVNKIGKAIAMEECVDVPQMTFLEEYFELLPPQKKAMEELEDLLPLVRYVKEHQICGGSLKGDEYTEPKYFKAEKLNRLTDLCQEHKKVIVVCRYNCEMTYIEEHLRKIEPTRAIYAISGRIKNRDEVTKQAEQSKDCIVLINAACSEGYELPSFRLMLFYSYDFSLKNYIQIIGRNKRINKLEKNVYISLIVKDSIDEAVYQSITNKKDFDLAIYAQSKLRAKTK